MKGKMKRFESLISEGVEEAKLAEEEVKIAKEEVKRSDEEKGKIL